MGYGCAMQIRAICLTSNEVIDAAVVADLLEQMTLNALSLTAEQCHIVLFLQFNSFNFNNLQKFLLQKISLATHLATHQPYNGFRHIYQPTMELAQAYSRWEMLYIRASAHIPSPAAPCLWPSRSHQLSSCRKASTAHRTNSS